jgi:hypothetical protein
MFVAMALAKFYSSGRSKQIFCGSNMSGDLLNFDTQPAVLCPLCWVDSLLLRQQGIIAIILPIIVSVAWNSMDAYF